MRSARQVSSPVDVPVSMRKAPLREGQVTWSAATLPRDSRARVGAVVFEGVHGVAVPNRDRRAVAHPADGALLDIGQWPEAQRTLGGGRRRLRAVPAERNPHGRAHQQFGGPIVLVWDNYIHHATPRCAR
ncbi:hypothetical protein [Embleya sp. NBC_00896]|uniref:hypothetical protein n=1 Tax=Embleya sp. NBC_00896 TaxID=2975961 RepID=UPI00386EABE6